MPKKLPPLPAREKLKSHKYLSMERLLKGIRTQMEKIPDHRVGNVMYSLVDVLMSGLAIFSFKYSSLIRFDKNRMKRRIKHNLQKLFGVVQAPCDTTLREVCDGVEPKQLRPIFTKIIETVKEEGVLEKYKYIGENILLSLDGTEHFTSRKVSCPECCRKQHRDGEIEYYHQMLVGSIVNPDKKQVLPLFPEAITRKDGENKNDCELNASKRLLISIRETFSDIKFTVLQDALYANAPNIRLIRSLGYSHITTITVNEHEWIYEQVRNRMDKGETQEYEETGKDGITRGYRWVNEIELNQSNRDIPVNYLDYWEYKGDTQTYSHQWITENTLTKENVHAMMKAGRSRWKVENETFNTVKNLGYHMEHNYGHGQKHLATVFVMLILLSFLIDQVQELGCILFQSARNEFYSRIALCDTMREIFTRFWVNSWEEFWLGIIFDWGGKWCPDTS